MNSFVNFQIPLFGKGFLADFTSQVFNLLVKAFVMVLKIFLCGEHFATLVTMEAQVLRCRVVGENVTPQILAGTDFCVTLRARDCWKHVLLHVLFVL